MYKPVTMVVPLADYRLMLTFGASERRVLDLSPYLDKGVFSCAQGQIAVRCRASQFRYHRVAKRCRFVARSSTMDSEPEETCRQRLEGVPTWAIEETTA